MSTTTLDPAPPAPPAQQAGAPAAAPAPTTGGDDVFIATENPYWELGGADASLDSFRAFFRRVARALPPVLALLRRAGPGAMLGVVACQLAAGALWAATLVLGGQLIQSALDRQDGGHGQDLTLLFGASVALAAVYLGKLALDAGAELLKARLSPALIAAAEQDFVEACLSAPLQSFDDPAFVDRMHRARDRGLHYVESILDQAVALSGAAIGLASGALALASLHPALLPVMLLCLLPQAWAAIRALLCVQSHWDHSIALSRQGWMLQDLASQPEPAAELRALQMEPLLGSRHRRVSEALRVSLARLRAGLARTRAFGTLLGGITQALAYLWLLILVQRGSLAAAQAGAAALGLRTSLDAVRQLVHALDQMMEKALYLDDYFGFVQQSRETGAVPAGVQPVVTAPEAITLVGVSFAYAGAPDRPVLQDIHLTLRRGQTIALVGENGSGKSTLAKLLAGLYEPSAGRLCWDGVDARTLDMRQRLAFTLIVPQHPLRWPYSAEQNVRLGRVGRPLDAQERAHFQAAVWSSQAQDVATQLPQGWQTMLNRLFKGGIELSSGQWQRLAVARGLYRDATLTIWDEPTAPLDARAEAAVYDSLGQLRSDRMVVLITHRLASARTADCIHFMRGGRIVESGTHAELMALGGGYAQLYALQARLAEGAVGGA